MDLVSKYIFNFHNKIINQSLPYNTNHKGNYWALKSPIWERKAQQINDIFVHHKSIPVNSILKQNQSRKIFTLSSNTDTPTVVVKGFNLDTWKKNFIHRKYAYNECYNLIKAHKLGVHTPKVYGLGYGINKGRIAWTAAIIEYFPFDSMRDCFLQNPSEQQIWSFLMRTIPSFKKLYLAGCNHVDFGPHAIMLSPEGSEYDPIIDFQYTSFLPSPCANNTAFLLGYFGWAIGTNRNWVSSTMRDQWYKLVLKKLEIPYTLTIEKIIRENEQARRPLKDRLKGYPMIPIKTQH